MIFVYSLLLFWVFVFRYWVRLGVSGRVRMGALSGWELDGVSEFGEFWVFGRRNCRISLGG